jgi:hypothetical protein
VKNSQPWYYIGNSSSNNHEIDADKREQELATKHREDPMREYLSSYTLDQYSNEAKEDGITTTAIAAAISN